MSEWINCKIAKPPEDHSVLLYIVWFLPDLKSVDQDQIFIGFYSEDDEEQIGFYIEYIDSEGNPRYKYLKELDRLKVIAWTLRPRKPYKGIFEDDWEG